MPPYLTSIAGLLAALTIGVVSVRAQKICDAISIGLVPLTQMTTETWNGVKGGLYPDGANSRPYSHDLLLREHSLEVRACRADGSDDNIDGRVVVLGIGASNARSAFEEIARLSASDSIRNPTLRFLNVAKDGLGLQDVFHDTDNYWTDVATTLTDNGLSAPQVKVAWVMIDDTQNSDTIFPLAPMDLADELYELCKTIKAKFPSIKFVYFSSRPYAGYIDPTETSLGTGLIAPRDCLHGWAIKFLIERQISEQDGYTFTGTSPSLPALVWSSYLWADGTTANSDGLAWECSDFESDGFALSESGSMKAGQRIYASFAQDQLSSGWFTNPTLVGVAEQNSSTQQVHSVLFDGFIRISSTIPDVVIMNLQGKIMWSTTTAVGDFNVATSTWSSGIYVLRAGVHSELIVVR